MVSLHLAGRHRLFNHRLIRQHQLLSPRLAPNLIYNSTDLAPPSSAGAAVGVEGRRLRSPHAASVFWQPWATLNDDLSVSWAASRPLATTGKTQVVPLGRS